MKEDIPPDAKFRTPFQLSTESKSAGDIREFEKFEDASRQSLIDKVFATEQQTGEVSFSNPNLPKKTNSKVFESQPVAVKAVPDLSLETRESARQGKKAGIQPVSLEKTHGKSTARQRSRRADSKGSSAERNINMID